MAVQYSFGKIVTDGLVLCLDAADRNSYVSGSSTWRDVAGSNNGTLTNGPTFSSANGGSLVFDGVDDSVISPPPVVGSTGITIIIWFKSLSINHISKVFFIFIIKIDFYNKLFLNCFKLSFSN